MGNPGVYGKRRFERLDYAGGIDSSEVETELKTGEIFIQMTADSEKIYVPKPPKDITLTNIRAMGLVGTTAGSLTVNLLVASSGFATTTNIATVALTGATSGAIIDKNTAVTNAIATTQALIVAFGATTKIASPGAGVFISYTVD